MRFIAFICFFTCILFANENVLRDSLGNVNVDFSEKAYEVKGIHKKLNLKCNDCHLEAQAKDYSSAMLNSCIKCHGDYSKLAEYTAGYGHNNNVHQSPHYEKLDCDNCHKTHKPSVNMCTRCHTQEILKNLKVK